MGAVVIGFVVGLGVGIAVGVEVGAEVIHSESMLDATPIEHAASGEYMRPVSDAPSFTLIAAGDRIAP